MKRKNQIKFKNKLRYKAENFMGRGAGSMFFALFIAASISIFIGSILILLVSSETKGPTKLLEALWWSLIHTADPGTFTSPSFEKVVKTVPYRLVSTVITFSGILIFSLLIAFLNTFFQAKLRSLQEGRSDVLEKDFTLILGWNNKIFYIIKELIIANKEQKKGIIVILSNRNKKDMDEEISYQIKKKENTRIITRTGDPSSFSDLKMVNFALAKSIIVLSPINSGIFEQEIIFSDAEVVKILLALIYHPLSIGNKKNIVAEIYQNKNLNLIKKLQKEIILVNTNEIIAKIMAVTSRQTGLSNIYDELLSFNGCEIYIKSFDEVYNKKFGDIIYNFINGYAIGIKKANGQVLLNPDKNALIEINDKIILISEDDDICFYEEDIIIEKKYKENLTEIKNIVKSENTLFLGYNRKLIYLIKEIDNFVGKGSTYTIVHNFTSDQEKFIKKEFSSLKKSNVKLINNIVADKNILEELMPFKYDNVFLMASENEQNSIHKNDADMIYTLLVLRNMKEEINYPTNTRIITEILDIENIELIESTQINDYIVSNKLVSNILAQISEEQSIYEIYCELFSEAGSEVYIKPVSLYYSQFPLKVTFNDVIEKVYQRNEIVFGYKIGSNNNDSLKKAEIKLNPAKNIEIEFSENDYFVVLSLNES